MQDVSAIRDFVKYQYDKEYSDLKDISKDKITIPENFQIVSTNEILSMSKKKKGNNNQRNHKNNKHKQNNYKKRRY